VSSRFLLYGANGYTGELVARRAVERGLTPTLAGRNAESVSRLAAELGLEHRVATVGGPATLDRAIEGNVVVLNCAGPFSRTAAALADACIRHGVHYLDITGEIAVFEGLHSRTDAAKNAGVMLLPGVGFDVVPSDCLAAYVAQALPSATRLTIAIQGSGGMSRGTLLTSLEGLGAGKGSGAVRRNGKIVRVPTAWKTRFVDFGDKPVPVTTMPWGDVATAYYSTGIPNIEVYMAIPLGLRRLLRYGRWALPLVASAPVRKRLEARVRRGKAGPSADHRARGRSRFWAEALDDAGRSASARLVAPEGYELTVRTALECTIRALGGAVSPGFQTPSSAYGPDVVLGVEGVTRSSLSVAASATDVHR
jgi:short subunit dehydrogenase-like uncharacterized protein